MPNFQNNSFRKNKLFLLLPLGLSIFGLILILDSSSAFALKYFENKFYFFQKQFLWLLAGWGLFFLFSRIKTEILKKISFPLFIFSLFLLILVLIPGVGKQIYGGRRWISIGNFVFQPSELMKLSLIIYLSTLFEKKRNFLSFIFVILLVTFLLLLEPDFGTAIIFLAIGFSLFFVSGFTFKEFLVIFLLSLLGLPSVIFLSSYRRERFLNFLHSSFNPELASYHVKQVLIALGSGGIFGKGLGGSKQKFLFLPEVTTDSIFAVIGEEFGFIGSLCFIIAIFYLVYRILYLSFFLKNDFDKMLVVGIGVLIGLQALINLGAMVVLIPMTGVPLPFVSYGGSSLLICLASMGIVYNISQFASKSKL